MKTTIWILMAGVMTALGVGAVIAKPNLPPHKSVGRIVPAHPQMRQAPSGRLDELYSSTDTPLAIPDGPGGEVSSTITISDDVILEDMDVRVDITHPWVRDLTLTLSHTFDGDTIPTEVVLLTLFPGDQIEDMTDTWFNDEASYWITEGQPPFTADYKPMDSLSRYEGRSLAGEWTLTVRDNFFSDMGTLNSWSIETGHVDALTGTITQTETGQSARHIKVDIVSESPEIVYQPALTDNDGQFAFPRLDPGTYTLLLTHPYYDSTTVENVAVPESQPGGGNAEISSELRFYHTGPTGALDIPDNGTLTVILPVENTSFEVVDAVLKVDIVHTYLGDLDLTLISEDETEVLLADFIASYSADNMIDCRFDDHAERAFADGLAPFHGSWRPLEPMSTFSDENTSGHWNLVIRDQAAGDAGVLLGAELTLVHEPVTTGTIAGIVSSRGVPVSGARIRYEEGEIELEACADEEGAYSLVGVPGDIELEIEFTHEFYQMSTQTVTVETGGTESLDVSLTRLPRPSISETSSNTLAIPDAGMITDTIRIDVENDFEIFDVDVELEIEHTFIGDLIITLTRNGLQDTNSIQLADSNQWWLRIDSALVVRFDDEACEGWSSPEGMDDGHWQPEEELDDFDGRRSAGEWVLTVSDNAGQDIGSLLGWTLYITEDADVATEIPAPALPSSIRFTGVYPNPFNSIATLEFELNREAWVDLVVYDLLGRRVCSLLAERRGAGDHRVMLDAGGLPSGLYLARLTAQGASHTRKIVLIR